MTESINFNNIEINCNELDISRNGEIIKTITTFSTDYIIPNYNDIINIQYKINNSEWFSYNGKLTSDLLNINMITCLFTMKEKEIASFKCKTEYFGTWEYSEYIKNDIFNLEIILHDIYNVSHIDKDIKLYKYKRGKAITTPAPNDKVTIRITKDNIIDDTNCLNNVEINSFLLNKNEYDIEITRTLVTMNKNEISVLYYNDNIYTIELIDWEKIFRLNDNLYMIKINNVQDYNRIEYESIVTYNLQNKLCTNVIGNGTLLKDIETCLYNLSKGEKAIIYDEKENTESTIELIDINYCDDISKYNNEKKYYTSLQKKTTANNIFQDGKYETDLKK